MCHQLICYDKYAHSLWILLGHRCWLMLPLYLNFWTVQNYFWIGLNSQWMAHKAGLQLQAQSLGWQMKSRDVARAAQERLQPQPNKAMSNRSRKQLKRNSSQKAPKSRKKTCWQCWNVRIVKLSSRTSLKLLSCWSRRSGDQTCASRNPPRARAWYK